MLVGHLRALTLIVIAIGGTALCQVTASSAEVDRPKGSAPEFAQLEVELPKVDTGTTPSSDPTSKTRPNIILYIVDTLRADALRSYGNQRIDTPNFDALARDGILFENAFSPTSWTRASVASLLTSTYPGTHGAEDRESMLTESSLLLSEILKQEGYYTGIITTNPNIGSFFGFNQGFDDFVELYERRSVGYIRNKELNTSADEVARTGVDWIRNAPEPYFLVVLAIDPHSPYTPPQGYDRYGETNSGAELGTMDELKRDDLTEVEKSRIRSLYFGEVSFSDSAFGRLLGLIDEMGARDRTLVALTSDHGEEFWEHGALGHGRTLFQESIKVPLILRYPPVIQPGIRSAEMVENIDVAPSLLQLAGIPIPEDLIGRPLLSSSERETRPAYFKLNLQENLSEAVFQDNWKWIWNPKTQSGSLYDLRNSAIESIDVARDHPDLVEKLTGLLEAHRINNLERFKVLHPEKKKRKAKMWTLPERDRLRLIQLGYFVDDVTPDDPEPAEPPLEGEIAE